mgnify:FL=1
MRKILKKIKHKTRVRTRYRDVKKKAKSIAYIYRTNGFQGLSMYIKDGIRKRVRKSVSPVEAGDVLLISIGDELLDRYRTDHMKESLESVGVSVGKVFYYELKPEYIKRYNVFIFYRCPWLKEFEGIFEEIRRKNKVSIYAVDDLVIDRKYTDNLPVVQAMLPEDRKLYDSGVERHNKLMRCCDYAITTTEGLADELKKYDNFRDVYIDRNSMSDEMIYYADKAIAEVERDTKKVVIGYFSGTNTHNEDFQMVAPALIKILKKYEHVYIKLAGRLEAPEPLKDFADRLIFTPYVDWRRLSYELRQCDITLSPLIDSVFNRAKSENKWSESSLVEVATVASDVGAFKISVDNGKTGILVENTTDGWFKGISRLVEDVTLRENIARQAREYVRKNYRTTGQRAVALQRFLEKVTPPVIAFGGVNISAISGGNMVVKKHMDILRQNGNIVYGVESMDYHKNDQWQKLNDKDDSVYDIFRINSFRDKDKVNLLMHFDRFVATFWHSVDMVDKYVYMKSGGKKLYLVQNMEAGFYKGSDPIRRRVFATYRNERVQPITISKWCQTWLKDDFGRDAKYAPNGIELGNFPLRQRNWRNRKIKVLVEGDSSSEYKRVDESFQITNRLNPKKYEISYLSYNAAPKDWYRVDHTYIKIPSDEVGQIYADHDILVKSSVLESFSYPPLEILATGGLPVLVKNDGNAEYVVDGENAIYYKINNIDDAIRKIEKIVANRDEYCRLTQNGRNTAEKRSWDKVSRKILALYD